MLGALSTGWALFFWVLWAAHGRVVDWSTATRRTASAAASATCSPTSRTTRRLLIIVVEVCLIYSTAGWYKIQGSRWQDGTAVYYPMHLDYFSPWPALTDRAGRQRRA